MRPSATRFMALWFTGLALTACTPKTEPRAPASSESKATSGGSSSERNHVQAQTLHPEHAAEQAKADFAAGDCRLYAAFGYAAYYPGLEDNASIDTNRFEIIYIDGTSDTGGTYNRQGVDFAKAYNVIAYKNCGSAK